MSPSGVYGGGIRGQCQARSNASAARLSVSLPRSGGRRTCRTGPCSTTQAGQAVAVGGLQGIFGPAPAIAARRAGSATARCQYAWLRRSWCAGSIGQCAAARSAAAAALAQSWPGHADETHAAMSACRGRTLICHMAGADARAQRDDEGPTPSVSMRRAAASEGDGGAASAAPIPISSHVAVAVGVTSKLVRLLAALPSTADNVAISSASLCRLRTA